MSWSTPGDLKAQVRRLWERGDLLRASMEDKAMFPLRLTLKAPSSAELAQRFEAVRAWIGELAAAPHLRIEWREVNHRLLGRQRVPESVWVEQLDDALALTGKRTETAKFAELVALTRARQPSLLPWLAQRPLRAIELAPDWQRLLNVVDWVAAHPRSGVYLRQAIIPDVHTKFIEAHRGVLAEWLDLTLPPQAIDADHTGIGRFAARYGFRDKPLRIRFRVLDARLALLSAASLPDITLDAESFAKLEAPIRRVFITENETNFLAFPQAADSIALFGAGYGWDALARAAWLKRCDIHYWGDIDTHGFAILDQLRGHFEHVESFLMDRTTLMAHEALWGEESDQIVRELPRLTQAEAALFDELRDNRIRKGLRLEQERIGFQWVSAALEAAN